MKYIAINRCAEHDFWSIAIEDENGAGTRIVGGKCCGRWSTWRRWQAGRHVLNAIREELATQDSARRRRRSKIDSAILALIKSGRHNVIHEKGRGRRKILSEATDREVHNALQRLKRQGVIERRSKAQGGPGWFRKETQ